MVKRYKLIASLGLAGILAGCSTPYACPLNGGEPQDGFRCKSPQQNAAQIKKVGQNYDRESIWDEEEPIVDGVVQKKKSTKPGVKVGSDASGVGVDATASENLQYYKGGAPYSADGTPKPVYDGGAPYRVAIFPWTDANGVLHGKEDQYFSTPPSWNYGTLKSAGAGANVLGPAMPTALGFDPVDVKQAEAAKQQQNTTVVVDKTASTQDGNTGKPGPQKTETKAGVTQPALQLSE